MDDLSTGSESDYSNSWITWFLSTKGNEYFSEVDEEYILDRFNLTGLNAEVPQEYGRALELITDSLAEEDLDDEVRDSIETSARFLYGLIHARYILTSRGLAKMMEKYKKADFGRCPRVFCYSQPLLPVGLSDSAYQKAVKLYCPRCEDIYSPKSNRHGSIDGAYFGTTFPHMLFMVYPHMLPTKTPPPQPHSPAHGPHSSSSLPPPYAPAPPSSVTPASASTVGSVSTAAAAAKVERYRPKIFGFQINEVGKLMRWQEAIRDRQITRLEALDAEAGANL